MSLTKLPITPNVPQQIALKFPEGKITEGRFGDQVFYTLAEPADHCLYLDLGPAQKINMLAPRKGEPFFICKRWTGKKTDSPQWDVWRPGDGEAPPAPAALRPQLVAPPLSQAAEDTLEQQLRASLAEIEAKKKRAEAAVTAPAPITQLAQPSQHNGNGSKNGSNGHVPPPANGNGPTPPPYAAVTNSHLLKIPMNVAFCEVLDWMGAALRDRNEQWTDQARQDFCSTVLIQASRDGYLGCWERGAK